MVVVLIHPITSTPHVIVVELTSTTIALVPKLPVLSMSSSAPTATAAHVEATPAPAAAATTIKAASTKAAALESPVLIKTATTAISRIVVHHVVLVRHAALVEVTAWLLVVGVTKEIIRTASRALVALASSII